MPDNLPYKKTYQALFVPLCTLITYIALLIFRNADNNRLTSWKWAYADADIVGFTFILIPVLIAAYAFSKSTYAERRPAVFLFISSFSLVAVFWKEPEVIVDASRYFTQAKHLEIYGVKYFLNEWGRDIGAWTDTPLVPFIYGLIFKIFGETRVYIQIFTTFLFSMTVVITYLTGKMLWDKTTGFYAGAFILGIPYIFPQAAFMLVDVPTMFFLTFSIYTFIKAMEKGGIWIPVSSIAVFCALFSKYSTWMMLSVLPLICFIYLIRRTGIRKKILCRGILIALFGGLMAGSVVMLKFDVISGQIHFLREYQVPGLRRWGESFVSTFFYQIHPFITIAALYSFYEAFRKKDARFLIISWLILLVVIFQIKRSRYIMIVFPMLTLMASYGLQRIRAAEFKRAVVFCAAAASIATAFWAYLPFLQTMSPANLKNAGKYINSLDLEKVHVFTVPSERSAVNQAVAVPILDLYTEGEINYHHDTDFTLPFEKIETSPLRFTWEYENPGYYSSDRIDLYERTAVIVISNRSEYITDDIEQIVQGLDKAMVFNSSTGIFRYSPVVTVYRPSLSDD